MEYYLDNIDSHCEVFSCIIQTVYRGPYYTLKIKYVLSKFLFLLLLLLMHLNFFLKLSFTKDGSTKK